MKAATYKLVYNWKNVKLGPNDLSLVQVLIYHGGKRRYLSTGIKLTKDQWKDGKVVRHDKALDYNVFLKNKLSELVDREYEVRNSGRVFDLSIFDVVQEGYNRKSFVDFMSRTIAQRTDIRKGTKDHHEGMVVKLQEFGKIVTFADLTYINIVALDNWLANKGVKTSTKYNHHKMMKVYINKAISAGHIQFNDNPYLKFKTERGRSTDRKYLNEEELDKLVNEPFANNPRLRMIRDLFLFSCYTGLAYQDAAKLTPINVVQEGNEQMLKINRVKTTEPATIMLLPQAQAIIKRYAGFKNDKLLPYMSNQKMNEYLKIIGDACGISKELTTHVARHTFATTVTLLCGVSMEVVSKMLGHSSIKTTQIYAKIVDQRMKEEMIKLRSTNKMKELAKKKKKELDEKKSK